MFHRFLKNQPWPAILPGAFGAALLVFAGLHPEWRGLVNDWKAGDFKRLDILVPGAWWWGALLAGGILIFLAATARWWKGPWELAQPAPNLPVKRGFMIAMVVLMAAGAMIRLPRMNLSFYNDEAYSFRRHIAGAQTPGSAAKPPRFRPVTWVETCYQNITGNNSMLFSVMARASYEGWKKASGSPAGTVREWAVRLPVLGCGVLAIGAMGWLGMRVGGVRVGVLAALLTTLHPWHVRYSTEARCYGILMLLMPLLFLALREALRTGRWRWWLTFGALEYLTVACFFGAVHFLVGLNLLVAGGACWVAWRAEPRTFKPAWTRTAPLLVSGLLAVAVYFALNLPLFLQTARLVADESYMHNPFTADWFQDAGSFLAFGIPGPARAADGGVPVSFEQIWLAVPWMAVIITGLFLGLLGMGGARLVRRGGVAAMIPLASLAGAALTLGYCLYEGLSLLPWYSIFLLPGVLVCLAAGMDRLFDLTLNVIGPLPGALAGLFVMAVWGAALPVYLNRSRENLRAVVQAVRGQPEAVVPLRPGDPLLGVFWSEVPVYDRTAVVLHDKEDLDELMARAEREGRECFVNSSWRAFVAPPPAPADQIRLVEDPTRFERMASFPGLDEPGNEHVLWKLKPPVRP